MTRRTAIAALGASSLFARAAYSQQAAEKDGGLKAGVERAPRKSPLICVYSQNLIKVPYPELGLIAQQIGYDGVDLTVMEGGHVSPKITNVDLVRAIESVRGAGLEVPTISTTLTTLSDPGAAPILAIAGHTQVHLFRTGFWPYAAPGATADIPRRLAQVHNDLSSLVTIGRNYQMAAMFPNRAGSFVGQAIKEAQTILNDLDPEWAGYYFDPSQATGEGEASGWENALQVALPRLKAVAVQDFVWVKTGDSSQMQMCPMGEGMIDWQAFFKVLAAAHYTSPISIHMEYQTKDEPGAMAKDLEFVRKQVAQAWGSGPTN